MTVQMISGECAVLRSIARGVLFNSLAECEGTVMTALPFPDGSGRVLILGVVASDDETPQPQPPPAAQRRRAGRKHDAARRLCFETVVRAGGDITLDSVEEELRQRGHEIPRSTLYDNLERLSEDGLISRGKRGYQPVPD